jgi:hypothetical protein
MFIHEREPMTPQQYCGQIADFLTQHPDAWTRGAFARRPSGFETHPLDPDAGELCLVGLLHKFVRSTTVREACSALLDAAIAEFGYGGMSIIAFNDTVAKNVLDIVRVLRSAASRADIPATPARFTGSFDTTFDPMWKQFVQKENSWFLKPQSVPDWHQLASAPLLKQDSAAVPAHVWEELAA